MMEVDEQNYIYEFNRQLLFNIKAFYDDSVLYALEQPNNANLYKMADRFGSTLLHYAANGGNNAVVRRLIELGAKVNAQDETGKTPLMLTLRKSRVDTLKILLEAGADIHIANFEGCSSLQMVVRDSTTDWSIVEVFLEKVNNDCKSMKEVAEILFNANCHLNHVITWGKLTLTRFLLEAGSSVNCIHSATHETPLHLAVQNKNLEMMDLLIEFGADVNAVNKNGQTPLMYIKSIPNDYEVKIDILGSLLSMKPDIHRQDNCRESGMSVIFCHGSALVVALSLEYSINLLENDSLGNAPLHYLARNEDRDAIKMLEGMNFDANVRDNGLCTPLHFAANCGYPTAVDFLLKYGADVNAKNRNVRTPLNYAIRTYNLRKREIKRNVECVELLLSNGADILSAGDETRTVFDLLRHYKNQALFKPILVYLAIREALGISITEIIEKESNLSDDFNQLFELYRREVKQMQEFTVYESVTLFQLLTDSYWKLVRYVRNENLMQQLVRIHYRPIAKSYCYQQMGKRVTKAIVTCSLQKQAARTIGRMIKLNYDLYSVVLDRIVEYLNEKEMEILMNVFE